MAGVWARLEDWLLRLQRDPERAARYARLAYWISFLFVLVGFVVILDLLWGST